MILSLENLIIGYQGHALSQALDFKLPAGSRLSVIGGNGAGKSTLLKTWLGLLAPLSGKYTWQAGTTFSYVPQKSDIAPYFPLSVLDVLQMGFRESSPKATQAQGLKKLLATLEMPGYEEHLFSELSEGQKQRVLLGRAMISEPQVLLLDEAFSLLDYGFRKSLWDKLLAWQERHKATLIFIEHDLQQAMDKADYLILLGARQSLCGRTQDLIQEDILSEAFQTKVRIHEEDSKLQIHFL